MTAVLVLRSFCSLLPIVIDAPLANMPEVFLLEAAAGGLCALRGGNRKIATGVQLHGVVGDDGGGGDRDVAALIFW